MCLLETRISNCLAHVVSLFHVLISSYFRVGASYNKFTYLLQATDIPFLN